jgi:Ca2+-binding EF-hand superfamily protein
MADENNDGQISQKEAIDAANLVVGGFFFRADQNGDGVLSQEEAKQAADSFFATKPWLRYVVETAKTEKKQQRGDTTDKQNVPGNLLAILDTNNDKQLQASELRQAVQTTVQGVFATADTNRDGQLSPAEVNAAIAGLGRQIAQAAFQKADTDNNGQISEAEFEKAILEPARVAFKVADLNHDGQLSQEEAQTLRQVIASKLRSLRVPEPSNSPRNTVNAAIGSQTQPAPPNPPR